MDTDLAAAYARCRELHRRHGRTYYLATRLLPAWKRRHVHALYGFTRYADEIVDRTEDAAARRARRPAGRLVATASSPACRRAGRRPAAAGGAAHHRRVRPGPGRLRAFLRSMAMDLTVTAYPTYDDLLDYMEGSAAVIGTMMLPILGCRRPGRRPASRPASSASPSSSPTSSGTSPRTSTAGRVYLPEEDLARFGVTRDDLRAARPRPQHRPDPRPDRYEVSRAREPTTPPPRRASRCSTPAPRPACGPRTCSTAASSTRSPRPGLRRVRPPGRWCPSRRRAAGRRRRRCSTRPGTPVAVPGPALP